MTTEQLAGLTAAARARRAAIEGQPAQKARLQARRARDTLAVHGSVLAGLWREGTDQSLAALVAAASLDGQPVTVDGHSLDLAVAS